MHLRILTAAVVTALILTATLACGASAHHAVTAPPGYCEQASGYDYQVCAVTARKDSCEAAIVDREDPSWSPTVNYGGGHGDVYESYGLGQADPGTKMAAYGAAWQTSPWVQLRWVVAYGVGRYGSMCAAWAFWESHYYW